MAYTRAQIARLKQLYKQLYSIKDPVAQSILKSKIKNFQSSRVNAVTLQGEESDSFSWQRRINPVDRAKKKDGIDAHSFLMEFTKMKKVSK